MAKGFHPNLHPEKSFSNQLMEEKAIVARRIDTTTPKLHPKKSFLKGDEESIAKNYIYSNKVNSRQMW